VTPATAGDKNENMDGSSYRRSMSGFHSKQAAGRAVLLGNPAFTGQRMRPALNACETDKKVLVVQPSAVISMTLFER
jgi:hypothetical protein